MEYALERTGAARGRGARARGPRVRRRRVDICGIGYSGFFWGRRAVPVVVLRRFVVLERFGVGANVPRFVRRKSASAGCDDG